MDYYSALEPKLKLKILNYLDLKYLLNCRLINREFNKIVCSNLKLDQLSIQNEQDKTKNSRFFQTNQLVNDSFSIDQPIDFRQLNANQFMLNSLACLKRIFISNCHLKFRTNLILFLNQLEAFGQLEQVQLKLGSNLTDGSLKLSRITTLSIEIDSTIKSLFTLVINCPRLHSFRCNKSLVNFKFVQTSTVKTIDLMNFDKSLNEFRSSLEVLYLKNGDSLVDKMDDLFQASSCLIELHCKRFLKFQNLIKLMKQKKEFKSDVDVYLFGFKIDNEIDCRNMLSDEHLGNGNFEIFLANNYERMMNGALRWDVQLQYDELVEQFNNNIPPDLFKTRLINLRKLSINGSNETVNLDRNQLVKLLRECRVLRYLDLRHLKLDQTFYDDLNTNSRYLQYLSINLGETKIDFDFKFILNHIYLETFSTDQTLPLHTIACLISNSKMLKQIKFKAKNNDKLHVRKNVDVLFLDIFVYLTSNRINRTFYNLTKLINYVGRFMGL